MTKGVKSLTAFKLIFVTIFAAFISLAVAVNAQGADISLENTRLVKGDTARLFITIGDAPNGLGRMDASIVSSDPGVVELVSINPELVSEQFIQIDSIKPGEIKFKMVDLGKKIQPGDKDLQILSVEVNALQSGTSRLTVSDIKYSDEEGNEVETEVTSSEVKVSGDSSVSQDDDDRCGAEAQNGAEKKSDGKETPEPEETDDRRLNSGDGGLMTPGIEEVGLRFGDQGKINISVSSLPGGVQLTESSIVSFKDGELLLKLKFARPEGSDS